jgi:hypothetical protein
MKTALCILSVLLTIGSISAAPLKPDKVPAGAKWMVHVDMEAFVKSKFGTVVFQPSAQGAPVSLPRDVQSILANQKPSDLRGFTVFGDGVAPENIVAIIDAAYDQERLLAKLKERPGYTTEKAGAHTIHLAAPRDPAAANAAGQPAPPRPDDAIICLYDAKTMVVGSNMSALSFVLDVLDGKEAGAADAKEWAELKVTPASYLAVRARHMDVPPEMINPANQARFALLTSMTSLQADIGETAENVFFAAACEMDNPESAVQIQQFVAGMVSLLMLQGAQVPELAKITQAVKLDVNDRKVTLDCRVPVADAIMLFTQRNRLLQGVNLPNMPPAR